MSRLSMNALAATVLCALIAQVPTAPAAVAFSSAVMQVETLAPDALRRAGESDAPGHPWAWPVDAPRTVLAPFRAPAHDYGPGHRGMDIAAALGEQIVSPASGVVAFRGTVVDRPLITIDHGSGYVTTVEPVTSQLKPGDVVEAGAVIGSVAAGGHSVPGTLHIGVRLNDEYINPRPLFGEVPRAVLLPCCT